MTNRRLAFAKLACESAVALAEEYNFAISVVAVDSGGRTIAALRTDHASYTSMEPARRKAITSASLQFPTTVVAEIAASDPVAARALAAGDDLLAVPGGIPLLMDGMCVGGVGIAGGHHTDDQLVAEQVLAKLRQASEATND